MRSYLALMLSSACACSLASCAAVDGAMPSRVYSLNLGSDIVRNQAILLNIVRASQEQPLTFVALSKITDGGNVQATVGIPSFNVGPALTAAQRIFTFGPNTAQTQITGSFDLGLLETTDFYNGILAPVPPVTINLLLRQGFPRELVFYALVESIRVTDSNTKEMYEYVNDPTMEQDADCPDFDYRRYYQSLCDDESKDYKLLACQNGYHPAAPDQYRAPDKCSYHRFEFYIQKGLQYGLRAETRSRMAASDGGGGGGGGGGRGNGGNTQPKQVAEGHFCFDPALSRTARKAMAADRGNWEGLCDGKWANDTSEKPANGGGLKDVSKKSFPFEYYVENNPKPRLVGKTDITVEFVPRSTFGLFRYLGRLLASGRDNNVRFYSPQLSAAGAQRMVNVVHGQLADCFAEVTYGSTAYCVPAEHSENTKRVFGLLTQLIALSTKPGDLPITPAVLVTP